MMRRRSDLPPTAPQPWSGLIPADSFYARLAEWRDVLVDDEDYAPLYKDSPKGRPSIPPSMVVLAMLLEYHDDFAPMPRPKLGCASILDGSTPWG
jgi:hypothetical protein